MGSKFAAGKKAKGVCDVCGFVYRLKELKALYVKGRDTNLLACRECWSEDHPQLRVGEFPVHDPQALRNPRPDSAELAASRELIIPTAQTHGVGLVGTVTVET